MIGVLSPMKMNERELYMGKRKIGIIFGGKSVEHEVSLQSAKNIVDAIDQNTYEVVLIGIDKEGNWHVRHPSAYLLNADDPKHIRLHPSNEPVTIDLGIKNREVDILKELDVIFPIVHGTFGEDGSLQGLLRIIDVPFVGTDVLGSAICMDKAIAKTLLAASGIHVAEGLTFSKQDIAQIDYDDVVEKLGTPLFIKPANQGSSVGVNKVTTKNEFKTAIKEAFAYDHKLIIEEAIVGREIEVSVLGNEEPIASLPGEILPKTSFYSYESKYIDETGAELAIPADLPEEIIKDLQRVAVSAFKALQCEGLARVDFFLTDDGRIYVNEINTLPGFTQISMYPKLWEVSGISYTELINRLIDLSIERHKRMQQLKSSVWE